MEAVSPSTASQESESPGAKRHRKSISTGGGRAWSQEEENYLIETRMHKMPYKHIATTLKKTELACRLHYHQLSFGSKRRRRTPSVTAVTSYADSPVTPSEGRKREIPQQFLPSIASLATPIETPRENSQEVFKSPQSHIPILPKPNLSRTNLPSSRGLRLITEGIDQCEKKPVIDTARLDKIYDAHRLQFWSSIARSYGGNLSPAALEEGWCKAHSIEGSRLPPTPNASPHVSSKPGASFLGAPFSAVAEYSKGFTSINNPVPMSAIAAPHGRSGSFALSSILTEDKEVRSPSCEKRVQEMEMTR
ncbi:MAG: hypothetical protein Q9171_005269 [Xanthocarpia ochracea]